MNHKRIYNNIINNAKSQNRIRFKKKDPKYVYYESHHIISKCLGGNNDKENLVLLTAREHYICHKLLTYIYKGNRSVMCAFYRMTFDKKGRKISLKDYAYAKELMHNIPVSKETIQKMKKVSKEYTKTEEYRNNMSILCSGEKNGMHGKTQSQNAIELIKEKRKLQIINHSEKARQNISKSKMGNKNPMFGKAPWNKGLKIKYLS
jgi:NUMOD3 motif